MSVEPSETSAIWCEAAFFPVSLHSDEIVPSFSPSVPYKLYSLLKRVQPLKINSKSLDRLKDISKICSPCDKIARKQLAFQLGSIKEGDLIFNRDISKDLMSLEGSYILHVVDDDTHFSAAAFLKDSHNTEAVWDAFMQCWGLIYIGMPDTIFCYQGSG